MSFIAVGAGGLLLGAGGGFLKGRAGDITRNRQLAAANLEGLDTDKLTAEALAEEEKYLPQATALSSSLSKANQEQLLAREEMALPGVGNARGTALSDIERLLGEDAQWLEGVQRRGAALGIQSGLRGSEAGQIGTLRLSDVEHQNRITRGVGLLDQLIGSLRIAQTPGVQTFMGLTPGERIQLRSQERSAKQQMMYGAASTPGQTGAWGDFLSSTGGLLTGLGLGGAMGGMSSASRVTSAGLPIPDNFYGLGSRGMSDYAGAAQGGAKWSFNNPGPWE